MRRGDMTAAARARGMTDRTSRAADERLLEALRRRDAGADLRHVAARLGFTGGAALDDLLQAVDEDLARSEGRPLRRRAPTVLPPGRRTCAVPRLRARPLRREPERGLPRSQPRLAPLPLREVCPMSAVAARPATCPRLTPALAAAVSETCAHWWRLCDLDRRTGVYATNGQRGEGTTWRDFIGGHRLALMEEALAAGVWEEPEPSPLLEHVFHLPDREWQRARRELAR